MTESARSSFMSIAVSRSVVKRALGYAIVVGAILISINHGDALLRGDIDSVRLFKMGLTVLVPYSVSTLSSVQATRDHAANATHARGSMTSRDS
ncbi:MAG: nitrate/nitrite transporter NrtS [Myxococcota bacterium]|jgi:hypothetical protein|nr:nitrate/nitrite transporter NrtS [Myxococcota bacterium]